MLILLIVTPPEINAVEIAKALLIEAGACEAIEASEAPTRLQGCHFLEKIPRLEQKPNHRGNV